MNQIPLEPKFFGGWEGALVFCLGHFWAFLVPGTVFDIYQMFSKYLLN